MGSKSQRMDQLEGCKESKSTSASTSQSQSNSSHNPIDETMKTDKAELQNLNDRLACYIDRVRFLEAENSFLGAEAKNIVESHEKEISNLKSLFESELLDVRNLLNEIAAEKAQLEMDVKRLSEDNTDLKSHLDERTKELNEARLIEQCFDDLKIKCHTEIAKKEKVLSDNNKLENEIAKLKSALNDLRQHLEEEILARVHAENMAQSLREELVFNEQIHVQNLKDTRDRMMMGANESNGQPTEKKPEASLQKSLRELREQYEDRICQNRNELEALYELKIKKYQDEVNRVASSSPNEIENIRYLQNQIASLNKKIIDLDNQSSARIRELEDLLDTQMRLRAEDETEICRLREEIVQQLQKYQDLMDVKCSLDLEIAAYNKLLAVEEERLKSFNLPPCLSEKSSGHPNLSATTVKTEHSKKRKRMSCE